jgi:hypothetical protein
MELIGMRKKPLRGGKRDNAGRPLKYNEPTRNITFRCPESKADELRKLVKSWLSSAALSAFS